MTQAAWRKYSEWPLIAAAVIFLVAYSVEVIANLTDRQSEALDIVIWATWALFIVDYVANLILAERRLHWFTRNLYEVIILALPVLRPLRLLRLVALLKLMQNVAGRAFRGRIVTYVLASALLLTYVGALAELDAEQDAIGSNIRNFGDALWWSAVTITTVGYGDHYPVTFVGRMVAVGLMIGGIAVLGVITAALASWLIEQVGKQTENSEEKLEMELAAVNARLDRLTSLLEGASGDTDGRYVGRTDESPRE
jgi:voltage-gated potassium channel